MTFRQIDTHKRTPDANDLNVLAADERGPDGSHHVYYIADLDTRTRPHLPAEQEFARQAAIDFFLANPDKRLQYVTIAFQSGSPAEHGLNGVTIESLLAVCMDRLQGLQSGPHACAENATVLTNLRASIATLHGRTRRREAEGATSAQAQHIPAGHAAELPTTRHDHGMDEWGKLRFPEMP